MYEYILGNLKHIICMIKISRLLDMIIISQISHPPCFDRTYPISAVLIILP